MVLYYLASHDLKKMESQEFTPAMVLPSTVTDSETLPTSSRKFRSSLSCTLTVIPVRPSSLNPLHRRNSLQANPSFARLVLEECLVASDALLRRTTSSSGGILLE